MLFGSLLISGRDWLLPAFGLLLAGLLVMAWAYRRTPVGSGVRAACLGLKLLGFVALFLCLLEPLWSGQRARPGANYLALAADNSQGMRIKDRDQSRTRGEFLRETLLTDQTAWQGKLEENFQVRRYLFDSRLQSSKDFRELDFEGRVSSLGAALRSLRERYQSQPLAGVLLFTDGNATDLSGGLTELSGLPPVYPVVFGSDTPVQDIALQKVAVTQTAFEDAPVSVKADVVAVGYAGQAITGQLIELPPAVPPFQKPEAERKKNGGSGSSAAPASEDAGGTSAVHLDLADGESAAGSDFAPKVVAEQTQKAPPDGETLSFRFQVRPERTGITFYRMRVSAKGELDHLEKDGASGEATLANNSRVVTVDRGRGPYRVLYVAGRPNWEYKFLKRAIDEDHQIQLVALIRIARREPKMEFRGRAGESSNPLFRGFGNQSEDEIERYDQPVLRRLNTRDEQELLGGFPKTAEELYGYHAVILDDVEAEFFTHDQMALLQKFVSERGGGFLMLGGQESFHEGKFERTPIGDLLPVYLDRVPESRPPDNFRLNLTREGWLQPWVRLRSNEVDEKRRLEEMPPFAVLNQVGDFKPGASVLATTSDSRGKKFPALVVQRFGRGRSAALIIGDLWRWGFRDQQAHKDMDKAWRQLFRWLVADVPERVEVQTVAKPDDPDQAVLLQARVRDEKFEPLDSGTVTLFVQPVGGVAGDSSPEGGNRPFVRIPAEPSLSEPGLYQATYIPRQTGGYLAEAVVTNAVGAEVGRAQAGWTSDPAAEEFRSLKPNRALLQELARKTGGEIIEAGKLDAFANSLPHRRAPIVESWSFPLWHQPLVFLLALGCFVAEWGLRRWKGLA